MNDQIEEAYQDPSLYLDSARPWKYIITIIVYNIFRVVLSSILNSDENISVEIMETC